MRASATRRLLPPVVLAAAAFAAYATALGNGFVFDDVPTILHNDLIREPGRLLELFTGKGGAGYRPVRYLSLALDYQISGDDPWAYHLFNVVYHALAGCAVFALLRRLAPDALWPAAIGALLFVVHPVQTEAVAYVSGRRDVLMALLYVGAFLCYLRWRGGGRMGWLAPCVVLFALALGTKEMAVTLPLVVALYDLLMDPEAFRRRLWLYGALGVLSAAVAAWVVFGPHRLAFELHGGSSTSHYATALRVDANYLRLLLWPSPLLADYSADAFPLSASFLEPRVLASIAALVATAATIFLLRRRAPVAAFGIGWVLVTLLPVAQIVPYHELAAEHHLYLPSVGLAIVGMEIARRLANAPRLRLPALGAAALLLVGLGVLTARRNRDWKDEATLWAATARTAPRCARAQLNLGLLAAQRGERDEAERRMRLALSVRPDLLYGRMALSKILSLTGRKADARAELERALEIARAKERPEVAPSVILTSLGRYQEALPLVLAHIEAHPKDYARLKELALCYEGLGKPIEALEVYERYLEARPRDRIARTRAARLALALGDLRRAQRLAAEPEAP